MINAMTPRRNDAKGFSFFTVLQSYILVSLRLCALASLRCGVKRRYGVSAGLVPVVDFRVGVFDFVSANDVANAAPTSRPC
jgi:hypothetical protein